MIGNWQGPDRRLGPAEEPAPERPESTPGPRDEFEPRFCPRCRMRIAVAVSDGQSFCNACLVARATEQQAAEEAEQRLAASAVDTHLGICPKCGSRNLLEEGWGSPLSEVVMASLFGEVIAWLAGGMRRSIFRVLGHDRDDPDDEVDIRMMCRDCGKRWRP